jgi:putative ABC transport system permease protein
LALSVRQRSGELAVRMVLGATPVSVIAMVVRHVAALLVSGCVLGATLILWMAPAVERLVFEVTPTEPSILAEVILLLSLIATAGSALPALRAVRVNPSTALRQ